MTRVVVCNQKGGVAKTTTLLTLARCLAGQGKRVLIIDTDPQGSVHSTLGLKPEKFLDHLVRQNHVFDSCLTPVRDNIHLIASNRDTSATEAFLMGMPGRELVLRHLFSQFEQAYDVVLIDSAPSISLVQACAMVYAQTLLIPVNMDTLALQGAMMCIQSAQLMNELYHMQIRTAAFLPVMMDRRYQMTALTLQSLEQYAQRFRIPILQSIRTDSAIPKAARARQFLADYDPKSKALEDYIAAAHQLVEITNGQVQPAEAYAALT
jgi:chromosome partitioning protein